MVSDQNRQFSKANNFVNSNDTIMFILHKMLVFFRRIRIFYQNLVVLKIFKGDEKSVR